MNNPFSYTICGPAARGPKPSVAFVLFLLLVFTTGFASTDIEEYDLLIDTVVARGHITADELALLLDQEKPPAILDVRFRKEYVAGHIPGAVHIPFNKVRKRLTEVPSITGQPLVVYCAHGPRAWMARRTLRNKGVKNVILLKGHWRLWVKQGHPVES